MTMSEGRRRHVWWKAGVSGAALAMLAWQVDWTAFAGAVRAADAGWLLAVVAIIHADKAWMAGKWLLLARGCGLRVTAAAALKSYYVGSFWGGLLAGGIGGEVIRISWLARRGHGASAVAWSVFVERVLGALAQAMTGLAGLLLLARTARVDAPALGSALLIFAAITAVTAALVFSRAVYDLAGAAAARLQCTRLQRAVARARLAILEYQERRTLLLTFLGLSVLEQVFPIVSTFAMARAFSIDLPLGWLLMGVPVILAVSRLPLALHDYGIKEGAYAFVLAFAGLAMTDSVAIAMVDRILVLIAMLPGALWTLTTRLPASGAWTSSPDAARPTDDPTSGGLMV
jgi:glycosyltransferase 2 family protein